MDTIMDTDVMVSMDVTDVTIQGMAATVITVVMVATEHTAHTVIIQTAITVTRMIHQLNANWV